MRAAFWLALVIGLGSPVARSRADTPARGPLVLERETKLLGWRLVADLPAELKGDNDPSRGWEASRFELVRNLVHFTMMVADSFGTVDRGELASIKAHAVFNDPMLANAKVEKLRLATWTAYGLEPTTVENKAARSLIYAAYVIVPKGTVKVFKFYVDPGTDQSYGWVLLAKKIVQTVRSGRNVDKIAAGTREICHSDCGLSLTTPDRWSVTRRDGQHLHWLLREVVVLGQPLGSCEISLSGKAGPDLAMQTASTHTTKLWDGTEWKVVASKDRVEAVAQTMRSKWLPLYLYCSTPDRASLDRILEIMSTLKPVVL